MRCVVALRVTSSPALFTSIITFWCVMLPILPQDIRLRVSYTDILLHGGASSSILGLRWLCMEQDIDNDSD